MLDLIVIGGGVNGTGIARDAAMRGLSVALLERDDLAVGASGNSSSMIHGGLRYLLADPSVTKASSRDSGFIQQIAPHLLDRIPFIYPVVKGGEGSAVADRAYLYGAESYVGLYDRYQPLKRGKPSTRLTAAEAKDLEPGLRDDLLGAVTIDEWGIDAHRLVTLNALDAAAHGARIHTYTEVVALLRDGGGRVTGVRARDRDTGADTSLEARMVFNATGAWSPRFAARNGVTVKMRPGKGVHLVLDRKMSNYGVITQAADGREMFVMPLENASVIGTTDDDYYGDPGDIGVTHDEVAYLLEGAAHMVPDIRRARVVRAWVGVRPTLYAYGHTEDALSRDHMIVDHATEGAPGLLSMIGGKLAAYRLMSEEAVDQLEDALGRPRTPCRTHAEPLPGGASVPDPLQLATEHGTPAWETSRLVHRHGALARDILALTRDDPRLKAPVCQCEGVLGAEVVHAIRHEQVRHLVDLTRRCRLGLGPCAGTRCVQAAGALFARERDLTADEARAEMRRLVESLWRLRRPLLDGLQLAQEELARETLVGAGLDTGRTGRFGT